MIRIRCFTNLDIEDGERWPVTLPCVPSVGDIIESKTRWEFDGVFRSLELRVVCIRWENRDGEWIPCIELHWPSWIKSIKHFNDWYSDITHERRL